MTAKPWTVPRDVTDLDPDAPVKGVVLKRAFGSLEVHLAAVQAEAQEAREAADKAASKQTLDRQQLQAVQDALRGKLDATEVAMTAALADLRTELATTRTDREERHREVMSALGTITTWQTKHEAWHEGVKDGKRDTGETLAVARAAVGNGRDEDAANPVADAVAAVLPKPWKKYAPWLVAMGMGLWAIIQAASGCAHLTPAEKKLADIGVSAGQRCVVDVAVDACEWGDGATGYKTCLRNNAIPCLFEHAVSAAAVGLGILWERYGMRLEGAVTSTPNAALAPVAACMDAIDAEYVVKHCPEGKADRLCVVDAVQWCAEHGADANLLESQKE